MAKGGVGEDRGGVGILAGGRGFLEKQNVNGLAQVAFFLIKL